VRHNLGGNIDSWILGEAPSQALVLGKDEQLDAGIRYLEDQVVKEPIKDVPPPAFPRKGSSEPHKDDRPPTSLVQPCMPFYALST
jgi:hypothetical protein